MKEVRNMITRSNSGVYNEWNEMKTQSNGRDNITRVRMQ